MSHFTTVKSRIESLNLLKLTLTELNVNWYASSSEEQPYLLNYNGEQRAVDVAFLVDDAFEVGFAWNKDGNNYEFLADMLFWQGSTGADEFFATVTARYFYNAVVSEYDTLADYNDVEVGMHLEAKTTKVDSLNLALQ